MQCVVQQTLHMAEANPPNQKVVFNQQMGLPPDAPAAAIHAFLQALQAGKGSVKNNGLTQDTRKKAEEAIIGYMKQRGLTFLQVQDQYLLYENNMKPIGWCDELIEKCFVQFHRTRKNQGVPLEQVAVNFVSFCKDVKKASGEKSEKLVLKKKRPMAATLDMLRNMGGI